MSTKIPSHLNQLPHSHAKFCGIIAEKLIAMISSNNGKCASKPQMVKKTTSLTQQTTTSIQLNRCISKGNSSFKLSDTPTLCVPELLKPSQIMCQLGNTASGSSQMNSLVVHAMTTLSRPEGIYFMNAKDSMGTGTLEEIH